AVLLAETHTRSPTLRPGLPAVVAVTVVPERAKLAVVIISGMPKARLLPLETLARYGNCPAPIELFSGSRVPEGVRTVPPRSTPGRLQALEALAVALLALQYALSNAAGTAVPLSIGPMTLFPV